MTLPRRTLLASLFWASGSADCCALQGFNFKMLKHLVLDEADRLLNMDFEEEIDQILKAIPKAGFANPS